MSRFISNRRLKLLRDGGFTEDQIDNILAIFDLDKPPKPDEREITVGTHFIYKPNGSYVYVSQIWNEGRWKYATLRFADGEYADDIFSSKELVHYLQDNKYKFWEMVA